MPSLFGGKGGPLAPCCEWVGVCGLVGRLFESVEPPRKTTASDIISLSQLAMCLQAHKRMCVCVCVCERWSVQVGAHVRVSSEREGKKPRIRTPAVEEEEIGRTDRPCSICPHINVNSLVFTLHVDLYMDVYVDIHARPCAHTHTLSTNPPPYPSVSENEDLKTYTLEQFGSWSHLM